VVRQVTIGLWYRPTVPPGCRISCYGLGWALGKSFGSLCCGSLVLAIATLIRMAISAAREQANRDGNGALKLALCLFQCCFNCFYEALRIFTTFTTVAAALSGQSFWQSGKTIKSIFLRHGISMYIVDRLASFVMGMMGAVLALALATVPWFGIAYSLTPEEREDPGWQGYTAMVCATAFVVALVVIQSFSGVVLNAVDALFICFAADKVRGYLWIRWPAPCHNRTCAAAAGRERAGAAAAARRDGQRHVRGPAARH
jgi:hypothetical protein